MNHENLGLYNYYYYYHIVHVRVVIVLTSVVLIIIEEQKSTVQTPKKSSSTAASKKSIQSSVKKPATPKSGQFNNLQSHVHCMYTVHVLFSFGGLVKNNRNISVY